MIREVAEMGTPHPDLQRRRSREPPRPPGADPLTARSQGLRIATIPAATDCLTRDLVRDLKEAGLDQMALSLDFPDAERHDAFRGVPGAFAKTLEAVAWAHEEGLPLQINTTVCGETAPHFEKMAEFVEGAGGRLLGGVLPGADGPRQRAAGPDGLGVREAVRGDLPGPEEGPLHRQGDRGPALPPPRRPAREAAGGGAAAPEGLATMPAILTQSEGPGHTVGLAPRGVNSGNGFLFVSHRGEIFPSGFLPLTVGQRA